MLHPINGVPQISSDTRATANAAPSVKFCDTFQEKLNKTQEQAERTQNADNAAQPVLSPGIEFSKHAILRAAERGIEFTPELVDQLVDSVERAQEKGATNILAFDATRAFIINVPNNKVITTISQEEMKENIFTNIDGAVLL